MQRTSDRDITAFYEQVRGLSNGILETSSITFFLLIAVKVFDAQSIEKGLLAASNNGGLLLVPVVVLLARRAGARPAGSAALLVAAAAAAFMVPVIWPTHSVYVVGATMGTLLVALVTPFLTQMYQDNVPARERGALFGRVAMLRTFTGSVFGLGAGWLLTQNPDWWRGLMLIYAFAAAFSAFCFSRIPGKPLAATAARNPFHSLRYLVTDRRFLLLQISWFLVGFGTLMTGPLRVEVLANPKYGVALDAAQIALYVSTIPTVVRLVCSPLWGRVFDRYSFFTMRVVLNLGFALSIIAFFANGSPAGLWIGAITVGIANAGGDIAWSLWATKYTTPDKVADYMAAHTFITGIRGALAPFLAFQLTNVVAVPTLGWIAAGMIVTAALLLVPEVLAKNPMMDS